MGHDDAEALSVGGHGRGEVRWVGDRHVHHPVEVGWDLGEIRFGEVDDRRRHAAPFEVGARRAVPETGEPPHLVAFGDEGPHHRRGDHSRRPEHGDLHARPTSSRPPAINAPSRRSCAVAPPRASSISLAARKYRWSGYERSTPIPPWMCWAAWTTLWPPSAAQNLAIATCSAAGSPSASLQAAWRAVSETASVST